MNAVVSICIPTHNRPDLLRQAVESCLSQRYRPLEILIGDDSDNAETAIASQHFRTPPDVTLLYERNVPALGQSGNVNRLFDRATGRRLLLLHDDDLLCPNGLDRLIDAWAQVPKAVCVYGKQLIIRPSGLALPTETEAWNRRYFRTRDHQGPQRSALVAALWQQVPNNCYLLDTAMAKATRCRSESEVGQCIDAEFVIRLGMQAGTGTFVYVDEPISKYRLTPMSIARSKSLNRRQDLFFEIVQDVEGQEDVEAAKEILLSRIGVGAALDAAMAGRRPRALRIVFSKYYSRPWFSRWTVYRVVCAVSPTLGGAIKRVVDRAFGPLTR